MKKLLITVLLTIGLLSSIFAQDVTFTVVKTDGTTIDHIMRSDSKIYYSDTQLFIDSEGTTVSYNLSGLRKAYFTVIDAVAEVDSQQLAIYPNPANDVLTISNISENQLVTIYAIDGRVVKKTIISDNAEINISDLRPGMYVVSAGNLFSKILKL